MRLSDCNLAGKTLYVLPVSHFISLIDDQIDGFPKEWQIRDVRVNSEEQLKRL